VPLVRFSDGCLGLAVANIVVLDLATKVVMPEQNIWSVFPGLNRDYLDHFIAQQIIYLDTPGINLTPRVLLNEELLRQHVLMSMHISDWHHGHLRTPPSRRAETYEIRKRDRSFGVLLGSVRAVFSRMQPGDLVLVGGRSVYDSVLIGEVVTAFDPGQVTELTEYPAERIPVRAVRWFANRYERRYLPQGLSALLSNRRAVVGIPKEEYGDVIFRIAYGHYVFGTDARYIFHGPDYDNIATTAVPGIHLISYFAAAFNAQEQGKIKQFAELNIQQAIEKYFEHETLYSFQIDFRSPGAYVLYAKRAALPLFVAVCVSATSGPLSRLDDARAAEIANSAMVSGANVGKAAKTAADDCLVEIQEKYKAIMDAINADRYNELCKLNKSAQDGVGLKVDVKQGKKK
jgi:hypothetical protein